MKTKGVWVECPNCNHKQITFAEGKVICSECKKKFKRVIHETTSSEPSEYVDYLKAADLARKRSPLGRT